MWEETKLDILLFTLFFFAELFGLWPMVIMLKRDLPKQLLSNIFFENLKYKKFLLDGFGSFGGKSSLLAVTHNLCSHTIFPIAVVQK